MIKPLLICLSAHINKQPDAYKHYSIEDVPKMLSDLREVPGVSEAVVVQKCNSTELYYYGLDESIPAALDCWKDNAQLSKAFDPTEISIYRDKQCIRHALRSASGLMSVTIGDNQVVGQFREAYRIAKEAATVGPVLTALFSMARRISTDVKRKTQIGTGNTSVARTSVEMMDHEGKAKDSKILVIGAGAMGSLVAKSLSEKGYTSVTVANRTLMKASMLVDKGRASKAQSIEEALLAISSFDAVFLAISKSIDGDQVNGDFVKSGATFYDLGNPLVSKNFPVGCKIITIKDIKNYSENNLSRRKGQLVAASDVIEKAISKVLKEIENKLVHRNIAENLRQSQGQAYDNDYINRFKAKSQFLGAIREYLSAESFIEVETPYVIAVPSDPIRNVEEEIFPLKWYSKNMYLRQSNQLHKQMLILNGFEKIYEIGPFWRAETQLTPRHLSESHGLDVEIYNPKGVNDLLAIIGGLISFLTRELAKVGAINSDDVIGEEIRSFEYDEIQVILDQNHIPHNYNEDMGYEIELQLSEIIKRDFGLDIFAIVHYPRTIKKFYTKSYREKYTETFDVIYRGWEISSGAIRATDVESIKNEMKAFRISPSKYSFYFDRFKSDREHGGFCIGTDRLFVKLMGLEQIRDSLIFPRSKDIVIP